MRLEIDYDRIDPGREIKPLELLLHLVISGRMDPWDIDIAEITDRYMEKLQEFRDLDLRISARAVLAGAILVRMKSEAILGSKEAEIEDEIEPLRERYQVTPLFPPIRRVNTRTTLPQLFEALLDALEEERYRKELLLSKMDQPEEATLLVDEDRIDVRESLRKLYNRIVQLSTGPGRTTFRRVLLGPSPVMMCRTFLFILFLVRDGRIRIWQEEFFGEIYIQPVGGGDD